MRIFKKRNVERKTNSDEKAKKFIENGYVEISVGKEDDQPAAESKDLSKMKVNELKALAEEKGIECVESLNRNELIAVLKGAM